MYSFLVLVACLFALAPMPLFLPEKRKYLKNKIKQFKKSHLQKKRKRAKKHITVILGDLNSIGEAESYSMDKNDIKALKETLKKINGYEFSYVTDHDELIETLVWDPPEYVMNFCEDGYMNQSNMELHLPALLEMLEIPYTGSGPECLAICSKKALVSAHMRNIGLPVPKEVYIEDFKKLPEIDFYPAIVKPAIGGGSLGISERSMVENRDQLINAVESIRKELPKTPIVVQEFLTGREYTVGIVGNRGSYKILPILETDYSKLPKDLLPILTYESKWVAQSPYWNAVDFKIADLEPKKMKRLWDYSKKIFESLNFRDYARFDFREDERGEIHLLEVNANPDWCLTAGYGLIECHEVLEFILEAANERWKKE